MEKCKEMVLIIYFLGLSGFAGSSVPPAAEHVDDLDFKDNSYNSEQDIMSTDYSYPSGRLFYFSVCPVSTLGRKIYTVTEWL